jgi:hypothetical protein
VRSGTVELPSRIDAASLSGPALKRLFDLCQTGATP